MTTPNAVNDVWNGVPPDPRKWATVPGATTQYTIELLPANGYSKCTPGAKVADSMIDADSRSLRIRVTGRAQSAKGLVTRSVIAALKRDSFLDFLWFTDYETSDPVWYSVRSNGRPTGGPQGDLHDLGGEQLPRVLPLQPWQRGNENWDGKFTDKTTNVGYPGSVSCDRHRLHHRRQLLGPLHTNDELLTCGTPTFGRNAQDRIESGNGYRTGGCSGAPTFQGTLIPTRGTIGMPATNATLATVARRRRLHVHGPHHDRVRRAAGQDHACTNLRTGHQHRWPTRATASSTSRPTARARRTRRCPVVFLEGPLPKPRTAGTNVSGCGDATISGTYDTDLTIATQNDIIVTGDVTATAAATPCSASSPTASSAWSTTPTTSRCPTRPDDPGLLTTWPRGDRTIDAAILTLLHSFTVDHYYCGTPDRQADGQRHDRAEVPRRRGQEQRRLGRPRASSRTTRTTRGSPSARRRTSSIR